MKHGNVKKTMDIMGDTIKDIKKNTCLNKDRNKDRNTFETLTCFFLVRAHACVRKNINLEYGNKGEQF